MKPFLWAWFGTLAHSMTDPKTVPHFKMRGSTSLFFKGIAHPAQT